MLQLIALEKKEITFTINFNDKVQNDYFNYCIILFKLSK